MRNCSLNSLLRGVRIVIFILVLSYSTFSGAQVSVNILAVNNSDKQREKEISEPLPSELAVEDIIDTGGLELIYNVNEEAYYVQGKITLGPKESKTIKVSIKDVWQVDKEFISDIKEQIENSIERLEGSEYADVAQIRKKNLLQRLDYIVKQQEQHADNVEKRIDSYRIYSSELNEIRNNAVSVTYWRSKPPDVENSTIFTYVIEANNESDTRAVINKQRSYLPAEVKPEHVVEAQGHDIRYDPEKGQSYLIKEEELKPGELKRYSIEIVDIWNIPQKKIDNLKDRTRKTFKLLENTEYANSAQFLVNSIKANVDKIEASQAQEKNINEHISAFRINSRHYEKVVNDVEKLEALLNAVRENLERSRLKNVLKKIQSLKGVRSIAEAVFGVKPSEQSVWKIILGIVIFVGVFTFIHFAVWGKRSRAIKMEDKKEEEKEKEKAEV